MSPEHWDDLGYADGKACDVYYPDAANARKRLKLKAKIPTYDSLSAASKRLFKLRASKLLVHEILHLYGVDHCVYYDCEDAASRSTRSASLRPARVSADPGSAGLMRGTGHLREDFSAPLHLCPVDLRKIAWRNLIDVRERYRALAGVLSSWGCASDAAFAAARAAELGPEDSRSDVIDVTGDGPDDAGSDDEIIDLTSPSPQKKRRRSSGGGA